MYKKRAGTSGIRGQLYETKLISLLLFRARHDDNFEEFQLASNVDGIGAFDDICIKAKLKRSDRPIALFIQAKHKEGDNALTLNNKNDLAKYFDSYLKIRRSFKPNNKDVLFDGIFEETECFFILYTNADGDVNSISVEGKIVSTLNALISTDDETASQPPYNDQNVGLLCKLALEEQITSLAARIVHFLYSGTNYQMMLEDDLISRYHVILAQKVIDVSDVVQKGYRGATFQTSFFENKEEFIKLLKDVLAIEVLKKRKIDEMIVRSLLYRDDYGNNFLIQELIGNVVMYNDKSGMLEFVDKNTSDNLKKKLAQIFVSKSDVNDAINDAAKNILTSFSFRVPAAFGNKDLTIKGTDIKVEKRLNHLTSVFHNLLEKPHPNNIVTIDESLGKGFLQLNGGIAGAVGNIFVLDENTELMKITDDCELLGDLAKNFLLKLKTVIPKLHEYRFDVRVNKFPRLLMNCSEHEKSLAKDFFSKLLFYTNQANESCVEDILINEIEHIKFNKDSNFRVTSHAIFLTYHDNIQNWWKAPDTGIYLTKDAQMFDKTIGNIVKESLMSSLNVIYRNKAKIFHYQFKEDALSSLKLLEPLKSTIVVTESSALTVAKVVQYCNNKDHVVLDLEYILNLAMDDCTTLCAELEDTNKNKVLIFVCDRVLNTRNQFKKLQIIAKAIHGKIMIIITNSRLLTNIKKCFDENIYLVNDTATYLTDMSEESQRDILNNAKVIFQGEEVTLNLIIDEESMAFVVGNTLNRMTSHKPVVIEKSLSNSNYEEIRHLYVNRRLRRGGKPKRNRYTGSAPKYISKDVETLDDITDTVVLVTAIPGMGKSTLLTHLSLKTKEYEQRVWIVRINLVDYSREFNMWQHNKTVIDSLETLHFMCHAILIEKHGKINKPTIILEEINGEVYLKDCVGDQATVFQLKMFLHFYNKRRIIFLFDGFDEICPHYASEVMQLLKTVRSYPRKHKMWIASRSYNRIKSTLTREFGTSYEIEHFSVKERGKYLEKFWKTHLVLQDFDIERLNNVYNFLNFTKDNIIKTEDDFGSIKIKLHNLPLQVVYLSAFDYIENEVKHSYIPLWEYKGEFDKAALTPFFQKIIALRDIMARLRMRYNGGPGDTDEMYEFVNTPLHLYLFADYFQNEINDGSKELGEWNMDTSTFTIYERFLETKLKKIRFQEKNKMDIYIPDIMITYEKEKADFIDKHKRLAAYAILSANCTLFSRKELKEIKNMIKLIKNGGEKTGLIYSVTSNNIPIFVHRTFAEYFAVEHFCDMLKNEKSVERQESLMCFMVKSMFFDCSANVRNILDTKLVMDDKLVDILKNNDKLIFDLLMKQARGFAVIDVDYYDNVYDAIRYEFSIERALADNLVNFVTLFISILDKYLNAENVDEFINVVSETKMFKTAIMVDIEQFIVFTLDVVRKLKPEKLRLLFDVENFSPFVNLMPLSNDEILDILHTIVKLTSSDSTPYLMNHQNTYQFVLR